MCSATISLRKMFHHSLSQILDSLWMAYKEWLTSHAVSSNFEKIRHINNTHKMPHCPFQRIMISHYMRNLNTYRWLYHIFLFFFFVGPKKTARMFVSNKMLYQRICHDYFEFNTIAFCNVKQITIVQGKPLLPIYAPQRFNLTQL